MKRFTVTPLFLLLKDTLTSSKMDFQACESEFDEFAGTLFSEAKLFNDKADFVNILSYTRNEFFVFEGSRVLKKNAVAATCLQKTLRLIDRQIDWTERQILTEKNAIHCPLKLKVPSGNKMKWTGSQVELVEQL